MIGSDNDSPKVFDDNQLYVILELSHGGEDVESFVFNNALQALSVFTQVLGCSIIFNIKAYSQNIYLFEVDSNVIVYKRGD